MAEYKGDKRTRTITWEDPLRTGRNVASGGALDYLKQIKEGTIAPPPVASLIGYRLIDIGDGFSIFELNPEEYHYNPLFSVHGGILSVLMDSAMTTAVMSKLTKGLTCSTVEIKVNFIRPVTIQTGPVRCTANIIHVGGRIATAEAKLLDRKETLYAHGLSTCIIFKPKPEHSLKR